MEYTTDPVARELGRVVASDPIDLARAALVIAKIEYPALDPAPYLDTLERLGARAKDLLLPLAAGPVRDRIRALNEFLYTSERFSGNRAYYGDYRNSLINLVLERRVGIPISLALVYMEVARRADLPSVGVAFPGHFLVRIPEEPGSREAREPGSSARGPREDSEPASAGARASGGGAPRALKKDDFVIIDPFNGGAELDEAGCRAILVREFNDEVPFTPGLLDPCTPRQMLARMLNNLKRTYLELRSFAHARRITDLLISTDPAMPGELRDRGLLAYHLDDFPAALRDLEEYLRLNAWSGEDDREERDRIWEHVKTLRRKVASMN